MSCHFARQSERTCQGSQKCVCPIRRACDPSINRHFLSVRFGIMADFKDFYMTGTMVGKARLSLAMQRKGEPYWHPEASHFSSFQSELMSHGLDAVICQPRL